MTTLVFWHLIGAFFTVCAIIVYLAIKREQLESELRNSTAIATACADVKKVKKEVVPDMRTHVAVLKWHDPLDACLTLGGRRYLGVAHIVIPTGRWRVDTYGGERILKLEVTRNYNNVPMWVSEKDLIIEHDKKLIKGEVNECFCSDTYLQSK